MELKHLRKGKINRISTRDLDNELRKLEARQAKYEKQILDNESRVEELFEIIVAMGESTNTHRFHVNHILETTTPIPWSEEKEEWYKLNSIVGNAKHALKKMQKKKSIIEQELVDRMLVGDV